MEAYKEFSPAELGEMELAMDQIQEDIDGAVCPDLSCTRKSNRHGGSEIKVFMGYPEMHGCPASDNYMPIMVISFCKHGGFKVKPPLVSKQLPAHSYMSAMLQLTRVCERHLDIFSEYEV